MLYLSKSAPITAELSKCHPEYISLFDIHWYYASFEGELTMTRRILTFFLVLALGLMGSTAFADDPKPEEAMAMVTAADQLYSAGKLQDAVEKYQLALKVNANLESAQLGLARSLLATQKIDEALTAVMAGVAAHPDSAKMMIVLGDIHFRRAEMEDAEKAYQAALQIDPKAVKAYLGLARIYDAYSFDAHSYAALKRAHDLDPKNPDVQLMWLGTVPRKERLAGLREYLAAPHAENLGERSGVAQYVRYLEKTADQPPHACRLVGSSVAGELKMENVHGESSRLNLHDDISGASAGFQNTASPIIGPGLNLKLNGKEHLLLLDTGADGILITRKMADGANLKRISDLSYSGIGEKGEQPGYLALADTITIGGMEFHDCVVQVADRRVVKEAPTIEGLIGADVFSSFLVDINFPQKMLRLSKLPNRPGDIDEPVSLNSAGIELGSVETDTFPAPKDRYIAPDMANWTRFLRFGHFVMVPTKVNGSKPMLFAVDSGSFGNVLSIRAAKSAAKVQIDANAVVAGASGRVTEVYRAEKVELEFGRFHQPGLNTTTFDFTGMSRSLGTEVSGLLGFAELLYQLDVKVDYRDGLVDFVYIDRKGVAH
jgi:tetratricopeptide (TPR) repeat protein